MKRILFVRDFRPRSNGNIRLSGGHIKIRDYFLHCLAHPQVEPYIYFTPRSDYENSELWREIPRDRIVKDPEEVDIDVLFLTDKDLKHLPNRDLAKRKKRINLMQTLRACTPDYPVYRYVIKRAYRIFVSPEIYEAGKAFPTDGEPFVIPNGIPLENFYPEVKRPNSILIWAKKNPDLGRRIFTRLQALNIEVTLLVDYLPREEFASRLRKTDIFVTCPWVRESFHLPSIEGMASGCAVVTSDNIGNRSFCIHKETCMMTKYDRDDQYVDAIVTLLQNPELKQTIQQNAVKKAQYYSLERERQDFYRFLERNIL